MNFNSQLENRTVNTIQLSKLGKLGPFGILEGRFAFF
jgi:hypothetical protein